MEYLRYKTKKTRIPRLAAQEYEATANKGNKTLPSFPRKKIFLSQKNGKNLSSSILCKFIKQLKFSCNNHLLL